MELLFDLESTGMLRQGSTLHCLVIRNLADDSLPALVFDTVNNNINEGLQMLSDADLLVGHNILGYDIPLLEELYPDMSFKENFSDTLVSSRLFFSTLKDTDFQRVPYGLPKKLYGRHSVKAWGIRLGEFKGDFAESNDWSTYTPEMRDYCIQDCNVNVILYRMLQKQEEKYQ